MKKSVITEIKNENVDKLISRLNSEKKELSQMYLDLKVNKLKNTRSIFHKRKLMSRILTILNEKRSKK